MFATFAHSRLLRSLVPVDVTILVMSIVLVCVRSVRKLGLIVAM